MFDFLKKKQNTRGNFSDSLHLKGIIELEQFRNGKRIKHSIIHNIITITGKGNITALMGNIGSPTAFTYLAVGTGVTAAANTDTALQTEVTNNGLARAAATVTQQTTTTSNDTLRLVKQWTCSGTTAVTECGIFNASSSGIILGHQVFSAYTLQNTDTFQLTYSVSLS